MRTCGSAAALSDSAGGLDPVQVGHADIHQHDVGPQRPGGLDRLTPVAGLANDLEVGLGVEDHAEACADERLVVGDQDADHPAASGWSGSRARTAYPCPFRVPASSRPP